MEWLSPNLPRSKNSPATDLPTRSRAKSGHPAIGDALVAPSAANHVAPPRYSWKVKVRDLVWKLASAGWVLRSTRGSHRQFKHPAKPLIVTVAGHPGKDVPIGTLRAILKAADLEGDKEQ